MYICDDDEEYGNVVMCQKERDWGNVGVAQHNDSGLGNGSGSSVLGQDTDG